MQLPTVLALAAPAARPEARSFATASVLGTVAIGFDLLQPWPLAIAVDHAIAGAPLFGWSPSAVLVTAAAALVVLSAVLGLVDMGAELAAERAAERVGARLRQRVFERAMTLSLRWHDEHRSGELLSRLTTDVGRILDALVAVAATLVPDAVRLVAVLGVLWTVDPALALVGLTVVPLLAWFAVRQRGRVKDTQTRARAASGRFSALSADLIRNVRAVQAFGGAGRTAASFGRGNRALREANLQAVSTEARWSPIADVVLAIGSGLVLVVGGLRTVDGAMTTGEMLVVLSYLGALYSPVRGLARLTGVLAKATASAARLDAVLHSDAELPQPARPMPVPLRPQVIRFERVGFGYGARRVLAGFDLEIHAGETVCLFGPSGIGKSTVLHLLLRLYDVDTGAIRIDGHDVRRFAVDALRSAIAFVPQDPWLFDASIADNIGYGAAAPTRHGIDAAARAARVDGFAARLPAGYDTVVGEGGLRLSGGERRRVALARAAISDAPIVVLDEPTASLDAHAAAGVVTAIRRATAGRTVLLVTHDRDLAALADRVVPLGHAGSVEPTAVLTRVGRG
jgi:ATP-binding cassette, subfamily B, bacterial